MKKLFISIFTCVFALFALGTSTFAWFTMNDDAKATGMKINAAADSSLVIMGSSSYGSHDTQYTSIGTNEVKALTMKPATSFDGIDFAKLGANVQVLSAAASDATWSGEAGAFQASDLISLTDEEKTSKVYYVDSVYSLANVGDAADVYVKSITVSANGLNLDKAIRVAITMGSNATLVFAPVTGAANKEGKVGKLASGVWSLEQITYTTVNTEAAKLGTLSACLNNEYTNAQDVTVRIWFEGQDLGCYSNAVNTTDMTVQVVFTTVKPE